MARLAIIDNTTNKVVNIAEATEINPIEGMTCVFSDVAGIGHSYDGLNFTPPVAEAFVPSNQRIAQEALDKSDMVALRCVKADVNFPSEWVSYVATLRAIVNTGTGSIPAQPAYPEGT